MYGIDICKISRIKDLFDKYPKFLDEYFTENEINYIRKKKNPYERMAGIFSAKEAIIKANEIDKTFPPKEIEIFHENKKPYGKFRGQKYYLSISHERDYAIAFAKLIENYIEIEKEFINIMPKRDNNSHKGTFGKIGIVGGSFGMTGSVYLSSNACLKSGAGLVYNVVDKEIFEIMSIKYIEPIAKTFDNNDDLIKFLNSLDVVAIGPGMGTKKEKIEILKRVLKIQKPLLIDADGLNNLVLIDEPFKNRKDFQTVLTPHPLEFSRLTGLDPNFINNNREKLAKEYAKKNKVVLVLKGSATVVTDGDRIYINKSGNPGMASAGSGDVLTGIISALLKIFPSFEAAKVGVYIHGLAGDFAKNSLGEVSMRARDIINFLPMAFKSIDKN